MGQHLKQCGHSLIPDKNVNSLEISGAKYEAYFIYKLLTTSALCFLHFFHTLGPGSFLALDIIF